MIKPSELTPRLSELMQSAINDDFSPEELTVITGDAGVGREFVSMPFDHLVFTGSTQVGRQVAIAAAANLTPVTLELGGKSPAIFNADFTLTRDVTRLMVSKLFNSGQTCIAPDYVAVPRVRLDEFVTEIHASVKRLYPNIHNNKDYTSIVNDRHFERLCELLQDAKNQGAEVVTLSSETSSQTPRWIAPTLVLGVLDSMKIMQQEIFGPLLPVMVYDRIEEVLDYINARERPLALYWFGQDKTARDRVLRESISGGVTINDCMWHFGQEELPFGGVGASGMGAYHGDVGFRTFSKDKPIFYQSALSGLPLLYPPYSRVFDFMEKVLRVIS